MAELKPCPFCGRIPNTYGCKIHGYYVVCDCGIEQSRIYKQKCDAVKHWNRRKTENCSEKPNICEDKTQTDCGDFANRLAYERGVKHAWEVAQKVFDSTVTFYEAEDVAKQIDKDEPQMGDAKPIPLSNRVTHIKDEPQTDKGIGCSRCEGRFDCYDRDMPHAVHCNKYGKITDEPQTE